MAENIASTTTSSSELVLSPQEEAKTELTSTKDSSVVESGHGRRTAKIELNAEFPSFIELRNALEKYQTENQVQLIVKDSKLLNAESTRRIIPKVYHLVNKSLMYHSITYCCKCHGELKQKPGTRIKNVGAKRLNCPMYLRFKLSTDLQHLTLFDLHEVHNHGIDPNTFQLPPRQQVYCLSQMKRRQLEGHHDKTEAKEAKMKDVDVHRLIAEAIKDVNSVSSLQEVEYEPVSKLLRLDQDEENADAHGSEQSQTIQRLRKRDDNKDDNEDCDSEGPKSPLYHDNLHSPLDPESSCSDSDEEEYRTQRYLLPFPIRLIGAAIQSSPELIEASKQLIEIQKSNLLLEKRKLLLQTKQLDLENAKLELEVKIMEKNLAAEMVTSHAEDTTIFLQA